MSLQGQPILGRTEPFYFKHKKTLGWQCRCGATENCPVISGDLVSVQRPVISDIQWRGYVRVLQIQCTMCGCYARLDTLHQVIDVEQAEKALIDTKRGMIQ